MLIMYNQSGECKHGTRKKKRSNYAPCETETAEQNHNMLAGGVFGTGHGGDCAYGRYGWTIGFGITPDHTEDWQKKLPENCRWRPAKRHPDTAHLPNFHYAQFPCRKAGRESCRKMLFCFFFNSIIMRTFSHTSL